MKEFYILAGVIILVLLIIVVATGTLDDPVTHIPQTTNNTTPDDLPDTTPYPDILEEAITIAAKSNDYNYKMHLAVSDCDLEKISKIITEHKDNLIYDKSNEAYKSVIDAKNRAKKYANDFMLEKLESARVLVLLQLETWASYKPDIEYCFL